MNITEEQQGYLIKLLDGAGLSVAQVKNVVFLRDYRTPNPLLYEAIEEEIQDCNGLDNFLFRLYKFLLDKHKNKAKACRVLSIHRNKMDYRINKGVKRK